MDTVPSAAHVEELIEQAVEWITSETRGGRVPQGVANSLLTTFARVDELTPALRALVLARYSQAAPATVPVRMPDGAFYR